MQDDLIEQMKAMQADYVGTRAGWVIRDAIDQAKADNDRIAALEAELAVAQDYKDCGCSYDHPNDLCLGHEKLFKRLTDKRIAALEADNARLLGLVKEATVGLAYIKAEATSAVSADGKETDPYALGRCRDQAGRTLAKIKEATDGQT